MFSSLVKRIPNSVELASSSSVKDIGFGTGAEVYKSSILPAIEKAVSEVILVTCFWQKSETRNALSTTLKKLSKSALNRSTKIRVRICFSSLSLWQKLFHTTSRSGQTYSKTSWSKKLGLPSADQIPGLDLEVKSIFFLPFSVMHPKFVIIDRNNVFLPSCNVSWEEWFEGYMLLNGPIVHHFFNFWKQFWASPRDRGLQLSLSPDQPGDQEVRLSVSPHQHEESSSIIESVFLSSPHNINPRFRFPWQRYAPPPRTPLNLFLLSAFDAAKKEIFLHTPNLTSPPVLDAIITALQRGVDVTITTSERLMILEQLVTAGTTTSRCIKSIIKQYKSLDSSSHDEELGLLRPGRLLISYYRARSVRSSRDVEPDQSHVKLTIVDDEIVIFGSGNMDRASWYTSQELGVAFNSDALAIRIKEERLRHMQGRTQIVFPDSTRRR